MSRFLLQADCMSLVTRWDRYITSERFQQYGSLHLNKVPTILLIILIRPLELFLISLNDYRRDYDAPNVLIHCINYNSVKTVGNQMCHFFSGHTVQGPE